MRIALLGYGRMGKAIEQIAIERGHCIVLKQEVFSETIDFQDAEVAIDFSVPSAAYSNVSQALRNTIPTISGTTGWLKDLNKVEDLCIQEGTSFLYASNFSLGVNLFFELNAKLAEMMQYFDYKVELTEIHHTEKLDAPSGTAITLAEQILSFSSNKSWVLNTNEPEAITINAKRKKEVPGTHSVVYSSEIDEIEIIHTAKNRKGFAFGAIFAAEYIADKKGIFTMKDVLGIV